MFARFPPKKSRDKPGITTMGNGTTMFGKDSTSIRMKLMSESILTHQVHEGYGYFYQYALNL
jgi:hypothetical protein